MALIFKIFILAILLSYCSCTVTVVKTLLQTNLFGLPELHEEQSWSFDPDAGKRRSKVYQQLNGKHGEWAIERLGLGEDGYETERLAQQQKRDEGQLGGVNFLIP